MATMSGGSHRRQPAIKPAAAGRGRVAGCTVVSSLLASLGGRRLEAPDVDVAVGMDVRPFQPLDENRVAGQVILIGGQIGGDQVLLELRLAEAGQDKVLGFEAVEKAGDRGPVL